LYMCAQGAVPFVAVAMHKGVSLGAALAFLLVAPSTNVPVLAALHRALGYRASITYGLTGITVAIAAGILVNTMVSDATVPEIHGLVTHHHHSWEIVCAMTLAVLLVRSLIRVGPRHWFAAMSPLEEETHTH
jgi:uncharacterized protein